MTEMMAIEKIRVLPGLNPVSRTDDARVRELMKDIAEDGRILKPLTLNQDEILVDGHRRRKAALLLHMTHVPVEHLDGDPHKLWRRLNGTTEPIRPNSWLWFYLDGGEPPSHQLARIRCLEDAIGRDGMEELARRGVSPAVYDMARYVSRYCEDESNDFLKAVVWWLVGHRQNFITRRAIADQVPAEVIILAVMNDKPLRNTWQVAA
jgi:hypothetical protein